MKHTIWLGGAVLALSSALVLAQSSPESILPPGFDDAPPPTRQPSAPSSSGASSGASSGSSSPAAAPRPQITPPSASSPAQSGQAGPDQSDAAALASIKLPSLAELEKMPKDELDELLGLKPKVDIPPAARRSLSGIGVLDDAEGGFAQNALAGQPANLVRASLKGNQGQLVSRWGHILLRRALASRLDAPAGMQPVEFAALRAGVLNRMGESTVARALVQDVDTGNYNAALVDAAFDAYLATADVLGICPVARIESGIRSDPQWLMMREICAAFSGDSSRAHSELSRAQSRNLAPRIDVLLARRFAGAAGAGRRAITIEWDKVEEITPWRFAFASALGIQIPDNLMKGSSGFYTNAAIAIPALPLADRIAASDVAGGRGVLSSAAMVDFYGKALAEPDMPDNLTARASTLREAYVAQEPAARLAAMKQLWNVGTRPAYSRRVLTAYAAARLPVTADFEDDAEGLIAAMLSAGLDANALRWGQVLAEGSPGWGLLVLAQPNRRTMVRESIVSAYIGKDQSKDQRKSRFLVAGLAGLGRIEGADLSRLTGRLDMKLDRETRWSRMIDQAAKVRNPALVALLAGVGMQGDGWHRMTPMHLYHIVSALDRVGLNAEARMIAAEAVARG